jgi:hypothetical protein
VIGHAAAPDRRLSDSGFALPNRHTAWAALLIPVPVPVQMSTAPLRWTSQNGG